VAKIIGVNPIVKEGCNDQFRKVGPLITVKQLKDKYLYGFSLIAQDGTPFPDSTLQLCIDNALSYVEHFLDISISTVKDFIEYKDYRANDYYDWGFLQCDNIPVKSVTSLELVYFNDEDGAPVTIQRIPQSWIRIQNHDGLLRLVPNTRVPSSLMINQNGGYFPELLRSQLIPQAWKLTYTFGFEDGKIPQLVNHAIGFLAASQALSVLGNLVLGAGIGSFSISLDGLSQSVNTTQSAENSAYSATIAEYEKYLYGANKDDPFSIMKILKNYYQGQNMSML
jgi:hypothetical protein